MMNNMNDGDECSCYVQGYGLRYYPVTTSSHVSGSVHYTDNDGGHVGHTLQQQHAEGHHEHVHGSYRGHAVPGTLFIVLGLHWTLCILLLLKKQRKRSMMKLGGGGKGGSIGDVERNGSGRRVLNATQSHSLINLKSNTSMSIPLDIAAAPAVHTTAAAAGAGAAAGGKDADAPLLAGGDPDCLKEFEYLNQTYYSPAWLAPLIGTNAPSVCCASSTSSPNTAHQSFTWCLDRFEPLLMTFFSIVGTNLELWLHPGMIAWRPLYCSCTGEVIEENVNVWQHSVMYLAFTICGIISTVSIPPPSSSITTSIARRLPLSLPFAILGLAFLNEALLFGFHLEGRSKIAVQDHTLLTYVVIANAFVCIVQSFTASSAPSSSCSGGGGIISDNNNSSSMHINHVHNSFTLAMSRAFLTLLQGAWFYGIAQNEYSSMGKLNPESAGDLMFVPFQFCIISMTIIIAIGVLYYIIVIQGVRADIEGTKKSHMQKHIKYMSL